MASDKATCSKCGPVQHNNGRCPSCGRMCKGHAPKRTAVKTASKGTLTAEEKKELRSLIEAKDMASLSAWFAERASSADVAFKYVKELAPYIAPKLSSIQSDIKTDTTYRIEIAGFEGLSIDQKNEKVIEHDDIKKS